MGQRAVQSLPRFTKGQKEFLKFVHKQEPAKPLKSLMDAPHIRYDEDGMGLTEYGIVDATDCTDEEIAEYFDGQRMRVHWPAQWDCSGQIFTVSIRWHRLPGNLNLVSYVHRKALDV